jgi:dTDP-4-dehydrorhamnose reductase
MSTPRRILVTGASGLLGGYLLRELAQQGSPIVAWSNTRTDRLFGVELRRVDISDANAVRDAFAAARPDVVLHVAAVASVNGCFRDPDRAEKVNVRGSWHLAELSEHSGARLVLVSTDLVFDGSRGNYCEADTPAPLSIYGRSKLMAEQAVQTFARHAVVRVSLLFGPTLSGRLSFFDSQLEALRLGKPLALFGDEWRTPLSLQTAAQALVAIANSEVAGLLHLGGPERMSRLEMGQRLAACQGLAGSGIQPAARASAEADEPRPADTSLDSSRWRRLFPDQPWPLFEDAVRAMMPLDRCRLPEPE